MDNYKLYDAEYRFAELVWNNEPINSTQLVKLCAKELGWKKSTTYTVLKKLCERGILQNQDATVTALVKREEVLRQESDALLKRSFGGSLPRFVTAYLDGRKISKEEAEELKRIIEEGLK